MVSRVVEACAPYPVGFPLHLVLVVEAVQHAVEDTAREEHAVQILLLVVLDGDLEDAKAALCDAEEALTVLARALQLPGEDAVACTDRVHRGENESFQLSGGGQRVGEKVIKSY